MSYDYTGLANTAQSLIAKFGRDVTLRSIVASGDEFDPILTPTDSTIQAVLLNYKADMVDDVLIKRNDKMMLTTSVIETSNEIVDGGVKLEIISIEELKPGSTTIIYKAQLRS